MWSFIKICLIWIIGLNRLKEKFQKNPEHMLNYSLPCSCSSNLSSFWLILKQQWTIEEIFIFSNRSHLQWRAGLSDTILKGNHPGTIPARFGLIWFSGFRGEGLNVIFYENMPNLHNRYISAERKLSQKNPEYMLNYFLPCSCSKFHPPFFLFLACGHLGWKSGSPDTILKGGHPRTIPPKFGCNWSSGFWGED